jgi:hypothetical protein
MSDNHDHSPDNNDAFVVRMPYFPRASSSSDKEMTPALSHMDAGTMERSMREVPQSVNMGSVDFRNEAPFHAPSPAAAFRSSFLMLVVV